MNNDINGGEMTIKLSTLKLNDRNPRTIKSNAFQRLCESIKRDPQFMKLRPIIVDEAGVILGGNQRYRACLHLGMANVPAAWIKTAIGLTLEQRKRFVVVDNAPDGMAGEWDFDILLTDWELPKLDEVGFELLLAKLIIPEENKLIDEEAMKDTEYECPKCGFKW